MESKNLKKTKQFEKEKIVKYFYTKNYGDIVKFEELQYLTHYNLSDEFESYKFKSSIMQKVKNELIENGYVIKSIRGIGYYILKQNQIQSYTYRTYIKKPLRHFKKAEIILNNTKTSLLNKKELTTKGGSSMPPKKNPSIDSGGTKKHIQEVFQFRVLLHSST